MKRCPECNSLFNDTDHFCELDGTTLVAEYPNSDPDMLVLPADQRPTGSPGVGAGGYQLSRNGPLQENWKILTVMAVAAVAIVVILFVIYRQFTSESPGQNANEARSNEAITQQQIPLPLRPSPSISASPSPEPSPSPSAMPSPSVQAESARVALSSSPVSTGGDEKTRRGQVIIQLTNGTSIEADEVWETGEGIWYRRRGVVTLLDREQVKAVEKPSPASSASATPATSPSASP